MARLFQCGFEAGSLTAGMEITTTSGSPTVQSSVARTGTYALRVNPTTSTGFARFHAFVTDQAGTGFTRIYLRVDTLPSANTYVCKFADVTNTQTSGIRLTTTGKLQLINAATAQVGSDSPTLSTGTWYRLELKNDATTNPGALDARLDGTSFASGANSAQGSWSRSLIGIITTNASTDVYYDDWAINDASGTVQTSWPGEGKILHLIPNGDGDNHAWGNNANGAGSSSNFTLVDEVPPNDATDVVQTGTLNAEDMYTLTDSGIGASDTVNVVMVGARLRNNVADATTAMKLQLKKTSGGTIAQGPAIVANTTSFFTNAPAEPRVYPLVTYVDPDGAAWTQATLDTAQAGAKLTTAGTNRIQISALWVSVDYTPAAGRVAAVTATSTAAVSASATAQKAARAAASATLVETTTAVARKVAVPAGVAPLGLAAAGSVSKTSAASASATACISAAGTARKAAPAAPVAPLALSSRSVSVKASTVQVTATLSVTSFAAAAKVAPTAGFVTLLLAVSRDSVPTRSVSALATLSLAGAVSATKAVGASAQAAIGLAAAAGASRSTSVSGLGALAVTIVGNAAHVAPSTGRTQITLAGTAVVRKVTTAAGTTALILSPTGHATRISVTTGIGSLFLSATRLAAPPAPVAAGRGAAVVRPFSAQTTKLLHTSEVTLR